MPRLFRVDMGYRVPVKHVQFFIEYVVAESPREALRQVLKSRDDMRDAVADILHALPVTLWDDAERGPVEGANGVRGGFRMDVEPSCCEFGCRGANGTVHCRRRFGDDPDCCAHSMYMFNEQRYVSVLEILVPGYRLVRSS